jgi:hypothetical protein
MSRVGMVGAGSGGVGVGDFALRNFSAADERANSEFLSFGWLKKRFYEDAYMAG